jgi:hypothetical protein
MQETGEQNPPAAEAAEASWFKDGLHFECTRCGHCCTGAPGFVWVDAKDIEMIAEYLGESPGVVALSYARPVEERWSLREKANGDCVFYDREAGCTVYPVRPPQCRTWPFWESNVATPEAWRRTCRICPGSGQGDWIPAEEIVRRMRVIKL